MSLILIATEPYTSLSSIKRLPVNQIKIDKSFVTNMLTDKKDAMIARTVIEFGHNFGLTVVAEGVETKEVLDALTALGCDEFKAISSASRRPAGR